MTIRIPKAVVALGALCAAAATAFILYEEIPALIRYIRSESM